MYVNLSSANMVAIERTRTRLGVKRRNILRSAVTSSGANGIVTVSKNVSSDFRKSPPSFECRTVFVVTNTSECCSPLNARRLHRRHYRMQYECIIHEVWTRRFAGAATSIQSKFVKYLNRRIGALPTVFCLFPPPPPRSPSIYFNYSRTIRVPGAQYGRETFVGQMSDARRPAVE